MTGLRKPKVQGEEEEKEKKRQDTRTWNRLGKKRNTYKVVCVA